MKKDTCSSACIALNWLVCLLLFLTTVAAGAGVYNAHFANNVAMFGSSLGSLAIVAFVASLALWSKWMCKCLCGCGK